MFAKFFDLFLFIYVIMHYLQRPNLLTQKGLAIKAVRLKGENVITLKKLFEFKILNDSIF